MPEFSMLGRSSPGCPKEEKIPLFSDGGAVTLLILALQVCLLSLKRVTYTRVIRPIMAS